MDFDTNIWLSEFWAGLGWLFFHLMSCFYLLFLVFSSFWEDRSFFKIEMRNIIFYILLSYQNLYEEYYFSYFIIEKKSICTLLRSILKLNIYLNDIAFYFIFHRCMALNLSFNTVISADAKGVIEYWDVDNFLMPKSPKICFEYKTETGIYDNQSIQ